ncbi:MAG: glycosyltransferase family 2 protein [Elusimicrobia bacterium CG08_land_8_20_14_0_20_51_18]|nr:MAG: glycosyltransferase family 2 protein [Elusimicrobia bacterium CG08_land_8_20_14_0_20_51_18]
MKGHKLTVYSAHLFLIAFFFFACEAFLFLLNLVSPGMFPVRHFFTDLFFSLFLAASFLLFLDLVPDLLRSKKAKSLMFSEIKNSKITIGMTAYNDELSIGKAVGDFIRQENVKTVVVVDNNSVDKTSEEAEKAGALVVREEVQGYGASCLRALKEAMKHSDIICLVEGDCTFSGSDLKKLAAYLENADMVVGTRTTKELNAPDSQMSLPLQWGNVLMAKLVQLRFRHVRLTDMGCTFRLIRKAALEKIVDRLEVKGNHFLCEMILTALGNDLMVIEIPVTLKKRVGESKGVGNNFFKAAATAFQMWKLILTR